MSHYWKLAPEEAEKRVYTSIWPLLPWGRIDAASIETLIPIHWLGFNKSHERRLIERIRKSGDASDPHAALVFKIHSNSHELWAYLFFIVSLCYLEPECSRSCRGRCNPPVCTAGWCYSCQRFAGIRKIRTIFITLFYLKGATKWKPACGISWNNST